MKTALYYYTGTGNSLWIARQLKSLKVKAQYIPRKNALSCMHSMVSCRINSVPEENI